MPKIGTVILALPASQYFRCKEAKSSARSAKRPKMDIGCPEKRILQYDESEELRHFVDTNPSTPTEPTSSKISWLKPSFSVGRTGEDSMNPDIQLSCLTTTCFLEMKKENVSFTTASSHHRNGALSKFASQPNTSLSVSPQTSQQMPPVSITSEPPPRALRLKKTLVGAVSNYLSASNFGEKRHSSQETSGCCLCHNDQDVRRAIRTIEELKVYVKHDIVEMLQPIFSEISTLKMDLQSSRQKNGAVQNTCGDVQVSKVEPMAESNDLPAGQLELQFTKQHSYQRSFDCREREHPAAGKLSNLMSVVQQNERYSKTLNEKAQEIETLQDTVHELIRYQENLASELEETQRLLRTGHGSSFPDGRPTLYLDLLESTYKASLSSIDSFTSHFVAYSEAHLHVPANKIWKPNFRNVYLAREAHWTYALKAFFCEKMFFGFENESFMTDAASLYLDPVKMRKESYAYFQRVSCVESAATSLGSDAHFKTFCQQKFDSVLPEAILLQPDDFCLEDMESTDSFPAILDVNLSQSFTEAAMKVWALHKLCFSFDPPVSIFRARRGHAVDWNFMESVVTLDDDQFFAPKVGFMICPGFHLRNSIVKSQVYLGARASERKSDVGMHMAKRR